MSKRQKTTPKFANEAAERLASRESATGITASSLGGPTCVGTDTPGSFR